MQALDPNCCLPAEDLALIREVARQAGAIAKAAFIANDAKVWDKVKGHPVTDADIAVNDYLSATLRPARPIMGGCRKRQRTTIPAMPARAVSSSIRSTAHVPSSTARRIS